MSEVNADTIDSVAFYFLVLLLVASGISGVLGFVVFVQTQYLVLFTVLFVVFLAMAIGLSFVKR